MYRSGGRFIHRDYSADELLTMLDLIDERAQGSLYTAITFYGLGGAIADIEKDETAFIIVMLPLFLVSNRYGKIQSTELLIMNGY